MKSHMNVLAVVLLLVTGESWGQALRPIQRMCVGIR